jgi:hypothetical protein
VKSVDNAVASFTRGPTPPASIDACAVFSISADASMP